MGRSFQIRLFVLFLLLSIACVAQTKKTPAKTSKPVAKVSIESQVATLMKAGKAAQAEALLNSAIAANPNSADLHGLLGKVLFEQHKWENAVQELGSALQIEPDSLTYNMMLAESLIGWNHFGVAIDLLQALRPKFGQNFQFHYDLGLAYYNINKLNEAKAEFEEALKIAPEFDRAEYLLAACYGTQGNAEEALKIFRKLVKEHPKNGTYWSTLAQTLAPSGSENSAEALAAAKKGLELEPNNPHIQFIAANILSQNGEFAAARPLFEHLVAVDPGVVAAHAGLARVYARLGERDLAKKETAIVSELEKQRAAKNAAAASGPAENPPSSQ